MGDGLVVAPLHFLACAKLTGMIIEQVGQGEERYTALVGLMRPPPHTVPGSCCLLILSAAWYWFSLVVG